MILCLTFVLGRGSTKKHRRRAVETCKIIRKQSLSFGPGGERVMEKVNFLFQFFTRCRQTARGNTSYWYFFYCLRDDVYDMRSWKTKKGTASYIQSVQYLSFVPGGEGIMEKALEVYMRTSLLGPSGSTTTSTLSDQTHTKLYKEYIKLIYTQQRVHARTSQTH